MKLFDMFKTDYRPTIVSESELPGLFKSRKVGDFIYPVDNGTSKWWRRSRWDFVLEVSDKGRVKTDRPFYDYKLVTTINLIFDFLLKRDRHKNTSSKTCAKSEKKDAN